MDKMPAVYILTNTHHTILYIGVTSDLEKRLGQHTTHLYPKSFSAKYNAELLIYVEYFQTMPDAIAREKEIKKWNRKKKEALIEIANPEWKDLSS